MASQISSPSGQPMCRLCGYTLVLSSDQQFLCTECGCKYKASMARNLIGLREFSVARAILTLLIPVGVMIAAKLVMVVGSSRPSAFIGCALAPAGFLSMPVAWLLLYGQYVPKCHGRVPFALQPYCGMLTSFVAVVIALFVLANI